MAGTKETNCPDEATSSPTQTKSKKESEFIVSDAEAVSSGADTDTVDGSDDNIGADVDYSNYPKDGITKPGRHDVLCGRGGGTNNHSGNVKFRRLVNKHKVRYFEASKVDKPKVAREIVKMWRSLKPPGRFLTRSEEAGSGDEEGGNGSGTVAIWCDVGDKKAREKASQCLRERTEVVMPLVQQRKLQQSRLIQEAALGGLADMFPPAHHNSGAASLLREQLGNITISQLQQILGLHAAASVATNPALLIELLISDPQLTAAVLAARQLQAQATRAAQAQTQAPNFMMPPPTTPSTQSDENWAFQHDSAPANGAFATNFPSDDNFVASPGVTQFAQQQQRQQRQQQQQQQQQQEQQLTMDQQRSLEEQLKRLQMEYETMLQQQQQKNNGNELPHPGARLLNDNNNGAVAPSRASATAPGAPTQEPEMTLEEYQEDLKVFIDQQCGGVSLPVDGVDLAEIARAIVEEEKQTRASSSSGASNADVSNADASNVDVSNAGVSNVGASNAGAGNTGASSLNQQQVGEDRRESLEQMKTNSWVKSFHSVESHSGNSNSGGGSAFESPLPGRRVDRYMRGTTGSLTSDFTLPEDDVRVGFDISPTPLSPNHGGFSQQHHLQCHHEGEATPLSLDSAPGAGAMGTMDVGGSSGESTSYGGRSHKMQMARAAHMNTSVKSNHSCRSVKSTQSNVSMFSEISDSAFSHLSRRRRSIQSEMSVMSELTDLSASVKNMDLSSQG